MYIGCGRLSIIITEGQMRIFLMTPVGVVVTTRGRERVKLRIGQYFPNAQYICKFESKHVCMEYVFVMVVGTICSV